MKTEIKIADGKYTIVHQNGVNLHILRNGEPWAAEWTVSHPNVLLAAAGEIEQLREALAAQNPPLEPTLAMRLAAQNAENGVPSWQAQEIYRAMLAAAPHFEGRK